MTKQFNLSEKIMFQMGDEMLDEDNMVVPVQDVKEFIRLLKEYENEKIKIAKEQDCLNYEEKGVHIRCCIDTKIFIDNLAGDKLK